MKAKYIICNMLLAALLLGGCASGVTSYINPDVDFSYIRRVAVFPFENLSSDTQAGAKVESVFLSRLLEVEGLRVVAPGETRAVIAQQRLPFANDLSADQIVALGKALEVEAIFFGRVEEYGTRTDSQDRSNAVTLTLTLVETTTGSTIWHSQATADGGSVWRKIFGGGTASMHAVTHEAVGKAMGTLF